jgi:hypothetical protein
LFLYPQVWTTRKKLSKLNTPCQLSVLLVLNPVYSHIHDGLSQYWPMHVDACRQPCCWLAGYKWRTDPRFDQGIAFCAFSWLEYGMIFDHRLFSLRGRSCGSHLLPVLGQSFKKYVKYLLRICIFVLIFGWPCIIV